MTPSTASPTGLKCSLFGLQETLKSLQEPLAREEVVYIPLGYAAGACNEGHVIPLRARKIKNTVEVFFFNLGEGAESHPLLFRTSTAEHYHFRYFPILMDPDAFFNEDLFTRLILLQCQPPGRSTPYSSKDCYAPFLRLGTVQPSFQTPLEARAEPAQTEPTCADTATVLITRDCLIDRGYTRDEIERFLLNERICALLSLNAPHALPILDVPNQAIGRLKNMMVDGEPGINQWCVERLAGSALFLLTNLFLI